MPVLIDCPQCKANLALPASSGEQRWKCSSCQTEFRTPATTAAPRPVEKIRFGCPRCSQLMEARADQGGQMTRCPGCKNILPIPTPQGEVAVAPPPLPVPAPVTPPVLQPVTPPVPTAPQAVFVDSGMSAAPRAMSLNGMPRPTRGKVGIYAIAGSVALVLLVGGIVLAKSLKGRTSSDDGNPNVNNPGDAPPPVSDLAFVPTDTIALISVRPRDIWNAAPIQDTLKQMPPEMQDQIRQSAARGVDLDDFERVTMVFKEPLQPSVWVVIKTNRAYNSDRLETLLKQSNPKFTVEEKSHEGFAYRLYSFPKDDPEAPKPLALHVVSDQLFVLGPEVGVKDALDHYRSKQAKAGQLERMLPLIESGKHQFLMGGVMTPDGREMLDAAKQTLPEAMHFLLSVQSTILKADLGNTVRLEAISTFPDQDTAQKAQLLLTSFKALAKNFLKPSGGLVVGGKEKELGDMLIGFVEKLTLEAKDVDLVIRGEFELGKALDDFRPLLIEQMREAIKRTR